VGQTGGDLLGVHILDSYAQTLDHIATEGLPRYFSRKLTPFAETAVAHFDANRQTWTERMIIGE
jgi:hypothetical protein